MPAWMRPWKSMAMSTPLPTASRMGHVFKVEYENDILRVQCTEAKHNLVRILRYLEDREISFGRVYSELPTLNDVFLEITGKELRD